MVERRLRRPADPLATYQRLRDAGVLGRRSYLHVSSGQAEIGWAPLLSLRLDTGSRGGWREAVRLIARQAAEAGSKAFGYLPFDLADPAAPHTLPDGSAPQEAGGELIVPSERVIFAVSEIVQVTTSGLDLAPYLVELPVAAPTSSAPAPVPASERTEAAHLEAVRAAVDAIRAGQLERVTLSRHRAYDVRVDLVALFRALCVAGNFADAYLVELGGVSAVIASPELLLGAARGELSTNPLIGTRARGATAEDDARLARELLSDPKEREEHALCVKTMIEELRSSGSVESVSSPARPAVFHLLHLQHLSTVVRARLSGDGDVTDVLAALFPAVTVTGSPRGPAMSLLRRLEGGPRGLYAGAVGWIAGPRDCRMSVAIRGLFQYGDRAFLHAGAGITSASDPVAEARESSLKLRAVEQALRRSLLH